MSVMRYECVRLTTQRLPMSPFPDWILRPVCVCFTCMIYEKYYFRFIVFVPALAIDASLKIIIMLRVFSSSNAVRFASHCVWRVDYAALGKSNARERDQNANRCA